MQIEFYHHPEIKIVNYNYLEYPKYRTVNSRPNGISVYIIISIFTIFVYFYIQHTSPPGFSLCLCPTYGSPGFSLCLCPTYGSPGFSLCLCPTYGSPGRSQFMFMSDIHVSRSEFMFIFNIQFSRSQFMFNVYARHTPLQESVYV